MTEVKETFKAIIKEQILHLEFQLQNEEDEEKKILIKQQIYALKELLSV